MKFFRRWFQRLEDRAEDSVISPETQALVNEIAEYLEGEASR